MDLRTRILRAAVARPAVLVAVCAGATETRLRLERELSERGWPLAAGPATANLLVVVGDPDPPDAQWCEGLWTAIPSPKARVHLSTTQGVGRALDDGAASLLLSPRQVATPRPRRTPPHGTSATSPDAHHRAHGHGPHAEHAVGDDASEAQDGQESDGHTGRSAHGGHADHDIPMMVAGLPMADRGDDRDGLRLDQLHLPLGPALLDWPAGLILYLTLQGDVIQRVQVDQTRVLAGPRLPFWDEPWLRAAAGEHVGQGKAARRSCASHLDSAGRLLAVAGWRAAAQRARAARDITLAGRAAKDIVAAVEPLVSRVGHSRMLRRMTSGLGELSAEAAAKAGVSGPALLAGGDVWNRLSLWLEEAARWATLCDEPLPLAVGQPQTGPRGTLSGSLPPPSRALLNVMPRLLEDAEFAGARLIVASLDPDLDELVPPGAAEAPHD